MNYNKKKICAVILVGGLSTRMGGGIKSLYKFNNKAIFDRIYENVKNQVDEIIINSNILNNNFTKYNSTIVEDSLKGFLGPLAGIHASLEWILYKKKNYEWLLTIPGDTPFIPINLVHKLFDKVDVNKTKIVLAKYNGKIHPIIGIWHTSLYQNLKQEINSGTRKILDWANKQPIEYVEFSNLNYDPFFNINYKEDIQIAEEIENKYFNQ